MWKLDWDHSVIIPGMQKDQSIHIENLKSERGKIFRPKQCGISQYRNSI